MADAKSLFKVAGLVLAGFVGNVLVAIGWMIWQPTEEPFWSDEGSTQFQEVASRNTRFLARLTLRKRREIRLFAGEAEGIAVVTISDRQRRLDETWAFLAPPNWKIRLEWSGNNRLTLVDADAPHRITLMLDDRAAK